jgi:hypothetical protein
MNFFKYLNEDYLANFVYNKNDLVEIFVNPTTKELRTSGATGYGIRFIIDDNKKDFYIWNGGYTHDTVVKYLTIRKILLPKPFPIHIYGVADDIKNGLLSDIEIYYSEFINNILKSNIDQLEKIDFSWVNKWFSIPIEKWIEIKKKPYLNEEYFSSIYVAGEEVPIFINPTPREILKNFKKDDEIRWFADHKKEKFYVFTSDYIHWEIFDRLKSKCPKTILRGVAQVKSNGKLLINSSFDITAGKNFDKEIKHFNFIQKYFDDDIIYWCKENWKKYGYDASLW